jgi:hypothetical protein
LLLAELHVERATALRSGGATEKSPGSSGGSGRRGGSSQQSAAIERHLAAAEANMALVQLGGLQTAEPLADPAASPSDANVPPSEAMAASGSAVSMAQPPTAAAAWQRTVRQQWLLGRIAELRRQPTAAAAAFKACRQLLDGNSAEPQPAAEGIVPNKQPIPAGGATGEASSVSQDAGAEQQPLAAAPDSGAAATAAAAAAATPNSVRLRGCVIDAVISAEAAEAKLQVCSAL